ncbi:hypothetical protein [Megasphaera vaginalis (ex Bordigoni et al. 2020)]|uniref:hypothetical protein n=1 Tax=Megasphaera vaginalis (ex Bordigoni et al. 2020) TaxID=2045301 RepID=UPI000C7B9CEC|nr:hypothetical protein [Megasphaera vaginalis (ex Bordigoni et al. 2020)]
MDTEQTDRRRMLTALVCALCATVLFAAGTVSASSPVGSVNNRQVVYTTGSNGMTGPIVNYEHYRIMADGRMEPIVNHDTYVINTQGQQERVQPVNYRYQRSDCRSGRFCSYGARAGFHR